MIALANLTIIGMVLLKNVSSNAQIQIDLPIMSQEDAKLLSGATMVWWLIPSQKDAYRNVHRIRCIL